MTELKELKNFSILIQTGHTHPRAIDFKISMLLLETVSQTSRIRAMQCAASYLPVCKPQEGH